MSSWATTSPRTFMNDANRNRFSLIPPPFENLVASVGPCAYSPKIPRAPTERGHVKLIPTIDGVPERRKEIYGTPVSKILPIHALSYRPKGAKASPFDDIVEEGPKPLATFASNSQRQLWPKNDITAHPEVYPPGPMTYELPDLNCTRSRSPTAVMDTFEVRESNSPVQKDPPPPLIGSSESRYSRLHSPVTSRPHSENRASPLSMSQASSLWSPSRSVPRGPTISNSPRHFNIHNINSRFRREIDPDFDNPAPGSYDAHHINGSPPSSRRSGRR